jgi:hypothetical protein
MAGPLARALTEAAGSGPPSVTESRLQQPLDDHAVAPDAIQPTVTSIGAHHPKAHALVQGEARRVLGEDAGHELPLGIAPPSGRGPPRRRPRSGESVVDSPTIYPRVTIA